MAGAADPDPVRAPVGGAPESPVDGVPPALVRAGRLAAFELRLADVPRLQAFFDANPGYFLAVNGRPPPPDEASNWFHDVRPTHLPWTRKWCLGLVDADAGGEAAAIDAAPLAGLAAIVSDLSASGVWHVGFYILADRLQGRGVASPMFDALECWMTAGGARWIRLGVVDGNARGARFWARHGFREVRVREGVDTGGRLNDVRVLVKSTTDAPLDDYLALVPRDQPGSPLP